MPPDSSDAPTSVAFATRFVGGDANTPTETGGFTVPEPSSSAPPRVNPVIGEAGRVGPRYAVCSLLGRGGMGEVNLCRDARIGRDVAVKLLLPRLARSLDARARFLREARVQGQLEHPTIVPVHDLEVMDDGSVYFTMKRVRGVTLAEVLERLRRGDEETAARFTRRRLLTVLATVCLGVDFAHSRGVVHRDLKPGNVMVGDFGEVYVLDWGLAKVIDVDDVGFAGDEQEITGGGVNTVIGAVMGTPGYMAPEQVSPSLGAIDARTDVYALGAMLFEVLTGRPVIDTKDRAELAERTLAGVEDDVLRTAERDDVAPELATLCASALATEPERRLPSARALHDGLERYLEGARDLERRTELARELAARAARALEAAGGDGDEAARGEVMQQLGRALALDPDNEDARAGLLRLLTAPPTTTPPEVTARVERAFDDTVRMGARLNVPLVLGWAPFIPLAMLAGVRDWSMMAFVFGPLALSSLLSFVVSREARPSWYWQVLAVAATLVAYLGATRVLGPFLFFPALVGTYAVVLHTHPRRAMRRFTLAFAVLALVAPYALESAGVLPRSYTFTDAGMLVHPQVLELKEGPITLLVMLASVAITILPALYVARMRDALSAAEERLQTTTWRLERLVPGREEARGPDLAP